MWHTVLIALISTQVYWFGSTVCCPQGGCSARGQVTATACALVAVHFVFYVFFVYAKEGRASIDRQGPPQNSNNLFVKSLLASLLFKELHITSAVGNWTPSTQSLSIDILHVGLWKALLTMRNWGRNICDSAHPLPFVFIFSRLAFHAAFSK